MINSRFKHQRNLTHGISQMLQPVTQQQSMFLNNPQIKANGKWMTKVNQ